MITVTGSAAANAGPGASEGHARQPPCYPRLYTFSSVSMRRESVQGAAGRATLRDKVDDMSGIAERRVSDSLTRVVKSKIQETSVMISVAAAATSTHYNRQSADHGFRDSTEHCGTYRQNAIAAMLR